MPSQNSLNTLVARLDGVIPIDVPFTCLMQQSLPAHLSLLSQSLSAALSNIAGVDII